MGQSAVVLITAFSRTNSNSVYKLDIPDFIQFQPQFGRTASIYKNTDWRHKISFLNLGSNPGTYRGAILEVERILLYKPHL
jgi:hypothetical protein